MNPNRILSGLVAATLLAASLGAAPNSAVPHPVKNPTSRVMLAGDWVPADLTAPMLNLPGTDGDPAKIKFARLPAIKGTHGVICPPDEKWTFQLHNYLLHHGGKFWCMWSAGPKIEDWPTQHVRYATSDDGLKWSLPKMLTREPAEGHGFYARDFWVRDGELLGLTSTYKGHGGFGPDRDMNLLAYVWDDPGNRWKEKGTVFGNAINNFAPQKLSTGEWITTRRDSGFNVSMLIGGTKALGDWRVVPVVDKQANSASSGLSPDEPICWEQPDGLLVAAFRDNGGSDRLFRAFSHDHGKTWSAPVKTEYPNAKSKVFSLLTSRGYRVLISNANTTMRRRELYLAISEDGLTFTRMARLDIPSSFNDSLAYPHAIEHAGQLWIAFSRKKASTELFKVSLDELEKLRAMK